MPEILTSSISLIITHSTDKQVLKEKLIKYVLNMTTFYRHFHYHLNPSHHRLSLINTIAWERSYFPSCLLQTILSTALRVIFLKAQKIQTPHSDLQGSAIWSGPAYHLNLPFAAGTGLTAVPPSQACSSLRFLHLLLPLPETFFPWILAWIFILYPLREALTWICNLPFLPLASFSD